MAVQGQPSSGGGSSGGGEVQYQFEEDVVEGRTGPTPDNPGSVTPFDVATVFNDKYERVYKPLFEQMLDAYQKSRNLNNEISYMNNFFINLHSHYLPVPIPLQLFVTNISWNTTKDDPYAICRINLKMPFSTATEVFSDEQGKLSPGQYLYISTKPATVIKEDKLKSHPHFPTRFIESISKTKGVFLGVISNINCLEYTEPSTGLIVQEISIEASSFLHNLQMGQYMVDPIGMYDDQTVVSPTVDQLQVKSDQKVFTNGAQVPFAFQADEWRILTNLINAVSARGVLPQLEDRLSTLLDEDTETDFYDNLGVRRDIQGAMQILIRALGYPTLPGTFRLEPFDLESWFRLFVEGDIDMEQLIILFYKDLSETEFNKKANWLINFMRSVGVVLGYNKTSFGRNMWERGNDEYPLLPDRYLELQKQQGSDISDVQEAVFLQNYIDKGFLDLKETRIGDIIRVATSRRDLPPSCSLRETMPENPPVIKIMRAFQNMNELNLTIWGLVKGTFHFDENLYELYPVFVPLHKADTETDEVMWTGREHLHKMHWNLGGIPYIIFRQVPMYPGQDISKDAMNEEIQKFNSSYFLNIPYGYIKEKTSSEKLGLNKKDDAPPVIDPHINVVGAHEIISITKQYTDLKRLNGVHMRNPFETKSSTATQNLSDSTPIMDGPNILRHGLRYYKGAYPLITDFSVEESFIEKENTTYRRRTYKQRPIEKDLFTAYAERMYCTYGNENNTAMGQIKLKYQKDQNIYPGVWLLLNPQNVEAPATYDVDIENPTTLREEKVAKQWKTYIENLFLCYVVDVSHVFSTLENGNVIAETSITYERGVYGNHFPVLPSVGVVNGSFNTIAGDTSTPITTSQKVLTAIQTKGVLQATKASPDDVTETAVSSGQRIAQDSDEGHALARKTVIQRTIERARAYRMITPEQYQRYLDGEIPFSDTYSYLQQLRQLSGYDDGQSELFVWKEDKLLEVSAYELGGWISADFATSLVSKINAATLGTKNPIPKALKKQYRAQARIAEQSTGYTPEIVYTPDGYDQTQWLVPDDQTSQAERPE